MPNHDIPQNPRGAAVLENDIIQAERVVEEGDLLVLDDCGVTMDQTFRDASCAAGVQDIERVREGHAGELQRLAGGLGKEAVQRWEG